MADPRDLLSSLLMEAPADDAYVRALRESRHLTPEQRLKALTQADETYSAAEERDRHRYNAEDDERYKRSERLPAGSNDLAKDITSGKDYETDTYANRRFENKVWDKDYDAVSKATAGAPPEPWLYQGTNTPLREKDGSITMNKNAAFERAIKQKTDRASSLRNAPGQTQAEREALEKYLLGKSAQQGGNTRLKKIPVDKGGPSVWREVPE
jgi:hypothetical protein